VASENATVAIALRGATDSLRAAGIDSPELTAERLLAHVLKCERADLYVAPERPLSPREHAALRALLARRLKREPLQYITGEVEFLGLTMRVGPGVLIPRPETEVLVERAVEFCRRQLPAIAPLRCLDVGTGCGNIAAALAVSLPHVQVVAVDCSEEALEIARHNLRRLHLADRVQLLRADLRSPQFAHEVPGSFHLVVANLPYVPTGQLATLAPEVKDHEPYLALDGGRDGLDLYRILIALLPHILVPEGGFFAEIGDGQASAMRSLLEEAGFVHMAVFPDLAGKERVVFASRPEERS